MVFSVKVVDATFAHRHAGKRIKKGIETKIMI